MNSRSSTVGLILIGLDMLLFSNQQSARSQYITTYAWVNQVRQLNFITFHYVSLRFQTSERSGFGRVSELDYDCPLVAMTLRIIQIKVTSISLNSFTSLSRHSSFFW